MVSIDVQQLTDWELRKFFEDARTELYDRQKKRQETCTHPKYVEVVFMRPGMHGMECSDCGLPKPIEIPKMEITPAQQQRNEMHHRVIQDLLN